MCLETVKSGGHGSACTSDQSKAPTISDGTGYKFVRTEKDGKLWSLYMNSVLKEEEWIEDEETYYIQCEEVGVMYTNGFHIYSRKPIIVNYDHSRFSIRKVSYKNVVATGVEWPHHQEVIVARQIFIHKEEEEEEERQIDE